MIHVRLEEPQDIPSVRIINERAFEQPVEADIVDKLRQSCPPALSLVAEAKAQVVGHILFTPATVESETGTIDGMGLAPMAVLPERERQCSPTSLSRHHPRS